MNKLKYKDHEYADLVYKNGLQTKYQDTELKLVALYLRDVLEIKKKKERREALIKFCEEKIPKYKRVLYFKVVNRAIEYSSKSANKLITIDFVPITKSEIDYINKTDTTLDEKKVMFALLFQHKLNKIYFEVKTPNEKYTGLFFKGGSTKYADLKAISNIPQKVKINEDIIHSLANKSLLTIFCKGSIRLDFIEKIEYSDDDEVVYEITKFLNVGYYIDLFNGNKHIGICKKCKGAFYKGSNVQKYCKECSAGIKSDVKTVKCEDCGQNFTVDTRNSTKIRCDKCQKEYRKRWDRERKRKIS